MADTLTPPTTYGRFSQIVDGVTRADLIELEEEIAQQEQRLASLRELEQMFRARLGVTAPLAPPHTNGTATKKILIDEIVDGGGGLGQPPTREGRIEDRRRAVAFHLIKHGAKQGWEIVKDCRVSPRWLDEVMASPWFVKSGQGYHITPQGRQEIDAD